MENVRRRNKGLRKSAVLLNVKWPTARSTHSLNGFKTIEGEQKWCDDGKDTSRAPEKIRNKESEIMSLFQFGAVFEARLTS